MTVDLKGMHGRVTQLFAEIRSKDNRFIDSGGVHLGQKFFAIRVIHTCNQIIPGIFQGHVDVMFVFQYQPHGSGHSHFIGFGNAVFAE